MYINNFEAVELKSFTNSRKLQCIDNHSSGYLGVAVKHCVRAYLGPHCILAQKQYRQKLMAQLNSTAFFEAIKYRPMRALVMPTLFVHCVEPSAHLFVWFLLIH